MDTSDIVEGSYCQADVVPDSTFDHDADIEPDAVDEEIMDTTGDKCLNKCIELNVKSYVLTTLNSELKQRNK